MSFVTWLSSWLSGERGRNRRARAARRPHIRPTFRPCLERLEEREVPAVWTGAVSGDWTVGGNWDGGVVPGENDPASFVAANNLSCYVPAGAIAQCASLSIAPGYTSTITLQSQIGPPPLRTVLDATLDVSGTASLDGGTIDQMDAGCTVTLGGGTWDGTALNSTKILSAIFVNGNLTVKGGAQTLGSDLYIQNSCTVDWQATNNDVTVNNAAFISVNVGSTLSFSGANTTGSLSTTVKAANSNSYVDTYGLVQQTGVSGESLKMPMKVESGGRLWVQDGRAMTITGSNATTANVSLYQVGGTTDLGTTGGTVVQAILSLEKGAYVTAGYFESLEDNCGVTVSAGSQVKISGSALLQICAGSNTTFGEFNVDGDLNLDGGTFVVYGKVGTGYDHLTCTGNITINNAAGGCTLSVYTTGAPKAGDGTDWAILRANSITNDFNAANFNWNGGYNWNHKNNGTTYDLTP